MRIQNNITVFSGDTRDIAQGEKANEKNASEANRKTIYAGNLLTDFPLRDRIQQRKAQAQERALKIVGDAWDGDRKMDAEIGRSKDRLKELLSDYKGVQDAMRDCREQSEALREEYHIDPDSQEQKDLELLNKAYGAQSHPWIGMQLTEEEEERVAQLQAGGMSEYMSRGMELNRQLWEYASAAYDPQKEIVTENAVIRGIRDERRKHHTMVDAQADADEALKAARDEILGMVIEEAKDHIDEEQENREEEAEEIKEEREEQEELLEERKENEEELEDLMEDMPIDEMADLKSTQEQIRQEVQNVVNKMHLVTEDIKGAMVDTNL